MLKVAPHTHGRTVGIGHFRMSGLKALKFVHPFVKFLISDDRCIVHVIAAIVLVQLLAELKYAVYFVHYTIVLIRAERAVLELGCFYVRKQH